MKQRRAIYTKEKRTSGSPRLPGWMPGDSDHMAAGGSLGQRPHTHLPSWDELLLSAAGARSTEQQPAPALSALLGAAGDHSKGGGISSLLL